MRDQIYYIGEVLLIYEVRPDFVLQIPTRHFNTRQRSKAKSVSRIHFKLSTIKSSYAYKKELLQEKYRRKQGGNQEHIWNR